MIGQLTAASGALIALVAFPQLPQAAADPGQIVQIQNGTVQCVVSADDVTRGGGPWVVCQRADLAGFGRAPYSAEKYSVQLNLAAQRSTAEFYFTKGSIAGPGEGTPLSSGQTYHINGWTIQPEDQHTRFTNDVTDHGMLVNAEEARTF
jgi:hypothetical protein